MATQTSTLKVTGYRIDAGSITLHFSEAVNQSTSSNATTQDPFLTSAANRGNYSILAPESGVVNSLPSGWTPQVSSDGLTVVIGSQSSSLAAGDFVQITVSNIASADGTSSIASHQIAGRVPSVEQRQVRDVEDAISYPVLTEEIAYRPSSPVGIPTTGAGGIAGPGASNIGQIAMQAVTDVLGWKVNPNDPKGFLGALTQSFTLKDVEGHTESSWVPRTYAVQTDLGGGITGAQASLYMRAKDALDQSLSLLDGLYPLDPDADPEYVRALREMARSQMTEIVKELGVVGLPSILRINTYFQILLGQDITKLPAAGVQLDPDQIGGTLGDIRQEYGIYFEGNPFNNSVEDEQDITNFRVISDYMTSLSQSWIANRKFFEVESKQPAFFGTQLVLISRQFNVIAETVSEVRFALDSVFIGPNERQTLLLKFPHRSKFPSMYLEDVLDEVDSFVSNEGPRLLRDGGKISVTNNILPVVRDLKDMIKLTRDQKDGDVPKGFRTTRVRRAMEDLYGQLDQLRKLTEQVEQTLPTALTDLVISRIKVTPPPSESKIGAPAGQPDPTLVWRISIFGNAFDPDAEVEIFSAATESETLQVEYFSEQRIDICFDPTDSVGTPPNPLISGNHDIQVTNPDGQFAVLSPAFNWTPNNDGTPPGGTITPLSSGPTPSRKTKFATDVTLDGNRPWGTGNAFSGSGSSTSASADAMRAKGQITAAGNAATKGTPSTGGNVPAKTVDSAASAAASDASTAAAKAADAAASAAAAAAKSAAAAKAPTKDELAELIKTHHPGLWGTIEDGWQKFKDKI